MGRGTHSAARGAAEGTLGTERRIQSHRATPEFVCAGICESDDNFNNICDEYEGCMDETACNYNPTATYDDGTTVHAVSINMTVDHGFLHTVSIEGTANDPDRS